MNDDPREDPHPKMGNFLSRYEYLLIYIAVVSTITLLVALLWNG